MEFFEREIKYCRKAFEDGNIGALSDAMYYCNKISKPYPKWLQDALFGGLYAVIKGDTQKGRGRQARWIEQYKQDMVDYARADTITDCIEHGVKWIDVYGVTQEIFLNTWVYGSEDAIKKSYSRYKKRIKEAPGRYYQLRTIHLPDMNRKMVGEEMIEFLKFLNLNRKKSFQK